MGAAASNIEHIKAARRENSDFRLFPNPGYGIEIWNRVLTKEPSGARREKKNSQAATGKW